MTPILKSIYSCKIAKALATYHLGSHECTKDLESFTKIHAAYKERALTTFPEASHSRVKEVTILLRDTTDYDLYPVFMLSDHNTEFSDLMNAICSNRWRLVHNLLSGYFYGPTATKSNLSVMEDDQYRIFYTGAKYRDNITAIYHNYILRFLNKKASPIQIIESLQTVLPEYAYRNLSKFPLELELLLSEKLSAEAYAQNFPIFKDAKDSVVQDFLQKEASLLDYVRNQAFIQKVVT